VPSPPGDPLDSGLRALDSGPSALERQAAWVPPPWPRAQAVREWTAVESRVPVSGSGETGL